MRIGVISDTHLPYPNAILWPELVDALTGVDLILHAGDIMEPWVLDELERIAPVLAAQGNHDPHMGDDPRVEKVQMLDLEGHLVAMLHEPDPIEWGLERVVELRLGGRTPAVLIYGDSHFERIDHVNGTLLLNPGSPILPRNMLPRLGHIAYLHLDRGSPPHAEIVQLTPG